MGTDWPLVSSSGQSCPQCDGTSCKGFPDIEVHDTYPFMKGGIDRMADKEYVFAPHRIVDPELGRVVYGPGDRVPLADAIKYGLIPKPKKQRARKPKNNRAHKPKEDRSA